MIKRWLKQPDSINSRYGGGEYQCFTAKRVHAAEAQKEWQAESEKWRARAIRCKEPSAIAVDILAAVFAVNRAAKRYRDLGRRHYSGRRHGFAGNCKTKKNDLYSLKAQAIEHLVREGIIQRIGYHRFGETAHFRWAELLEGNGYRFHRPCRPPEGADTLDIKSLPEVEAKPRGSQEPKLKDAVAAIERFLRDKPHVSPLGWDDFDAADALKQEADHSVPTSGCFDNDDMEEF